MESGFEIYVMASYIYMVGIGKRDMLHKGDTSMNTRNSILLLGLIILGIIVGGFLSLVTSGGAVVTGAACGGLLGGLLYCMIQMIVSRRKRKVLPYDRLDEQYPIHHEIHQTH